MINKYFEYMPKWIKKGKRVEVYCDGVWHKGTIVATPKDNDRGVEIKPDAETPKVISIAVYMCNRSPKQWKELLKRIK